MFGTVYSFLDHYALVVANKHFRGVTKMVLGDSMLF
jgi:hypothetical protein